MAALTSEQITRALEFQADFCELEVEDFQNPNFTQWYQAYQAYVMFGPEDEERGGQNPGHKPPI